MAKYSDFLNSKSKRVVKYFGLQDVETPEYLKDFQSYSVKWMLRRGRAACFQDCGMGKTIQQLVIADNIDGNVLIVAPLGVTSQTVAESKRFGIDAAYSRHPVLKDPPKITITNYERVDTFDADIYECVILDESSILKAYMGKTKRMLLEKFKDTPYRFCFTATPAPNDPMEIGNHSQFLGVMDSNEMLSRWFIADQGKGAGAYRLKKHAIDDFWMWVASWSIMGGKPSDMGDYSDDGYILPELNIHECVVNVDQTTDSGEMLFRSPDLSATNIHKEMRLTSRDRAVYVARLVNDSDEQFLVWCNTNYEADGLMAIIGDAVEIRGNHNHKIKEERMMGFVNGDIRVLVSKPKICGFGMNFQNCHNIAYVGLNYSYESLYQSIRRCWRFGQNHEVNCYIVRSDTEHAIMTRINQKIREHDTMRLMMSKYANNADNDKNRELKMDADIDERKGNNWSAKLGDSCELIKGVDDNSIDFTIFSPPFANLYIYSDSFRDMGNCEDDGEFFEHFDYLIPELLRVTKPGHLCAIHCKDIVDYKGRDGRSGLRDFPGEIIRHMENAGWKYHSRVMIWKDPVLERARHNSHGLLHKTIKSDRSMVRQGLPDYLVIFRKWTDQDIPTEAGKFSRYIGEDFVKDQGIFEDTNDLKRDDDYSIFVWQRYASPCWFDINPNDVLNYRLAKSDKDEKHICPLQLGVIERAVELWTAPGDTVFSPFMGVGSEGVASLRSGRKFLGFELKDEYFELSCKHLEDADESGVQEMLF